MRWIVGIFLHFPNFALSLQCLYCTGVVKPADCDTVVKCGSHEECYVDAYVIVSGSIRYDLGCRDSMFCRGPSTTPGQNVSHLIKARAAAVLGHQNGVEIFDQSVARRATSLLVCSECCTSDLCTNSGCGNTGYRSPRGPICYNCPHQLTPEDCSTITMCGQDEVCMLLENVNPITREKRYSSKCEHEKSCEEKLQHLKEMAVLLVGKRRTGALSFGGSCIVQCCIGDLCNRDCDGSGSIVPPTDGSATKSSTVISPTPTLVLSTTTSDPCLSNPCRGGTCSIYRNTYRCTCRDGFYGRNCELVFQTFQPITTIPTSSIASTRKTESTADPLTSMTSHPVNHTSSHGASTQCCPDGWIGFKGSCYYYFDDIKLTWSEANLFCKRRNGHLVITETELENNFVKFYARKFILPTSETRNSSAFWIGATASDVVGQWQWDYTNKMITSTEMETYQCKGHSFANQLHRCIALNGAYGFCWSAGLCTQRVGYPLCEINTISANRYGSALFG